MRIFVTCARSRVERARAVARALDLAGHDVVSRWHQGEGPFDLPDSDVALEEISGADEVDLTECDLLVALTETDRGAIVGRDELVDIGVAWGLGLPVVWSTQYDGRPALAFYRGNVFAAKRDEHVPTVIDAFARGRAPRTMRQLQLVRET